MKRKSLLFLLLFALIAPWAANAQVQIGSGETTNSYLPSYSYYNYSISQQIYTADEIAASGNITSIAFYNGGTAKDRKYDIYMALTTKTAFDGTSDWIALTDADIVYHGTEAVTMTVGAWTTFTLDTPFAYNGTSNLVVCMIDRTGSWSSGMACRVFDATNQSLYAYSDSYSSLNPNGTNGETALTGTRPTVKNQIILGGIQQAYPAPMDLACTGLTGNSATLSWTEVGTATSWQICLNDDETNLITANTNPFTLTGLTAEQIYTAKVRGYYDATHQSPWSGSVSFVPTNKLVIGSGTSTSNYVPANNFYNYSLTQQIYTAAELGAAGSILSIDFYKSSTTSMVKDLDIYMVSTTKNAFESTSDWIPVTTGDLVYSGTVNFADNAWTSIELTTPFEYDGVSNVAIVVDNNTGGYVSNTPFLVFTSNANANQAIYYYNDYTNSDPTGTPGTASGVQATKNQIRILKGAPSTCPAPTNLAVSASNRSAELSWTENGEANEWQICLDGDETNLIPADSNPFTLTGLTPETTYNVKVRAYCGEDDQSRWTSAVRFTTDVACPAPTALTVVPVDPNSVNVSWEGSANGYEMEYAILGEGGAGGTYTYAFEEDLEGWTSLVVNADQGEWLHSTNQPYGYDYSEIAHGGTGFAMCYSFIDYTGSYDTDAYLISPMMYSLNAGASLNFWYDMANDDYPEYFEVCVATAANPTAADFTAIWSWSEDKAMRDPSRKVPMSRNNNVRHINNTRYDNWREVTVDLSDYIGQTVWIAFHDVNYDAYEVWIDDVTVNAGASGEITWIPVGTVTSPYLLDGLQEGTSYLLRVRAVCGGIDGESVWVNTNFTTPTFCDVPFALNVPFETLMPTTATLKWTGYQDGFEIRYRIPQVAFFEEGFENGIPSTWTTIDNDTTTLNNWLALSDIPSTYSYYAEMDLSGWAHSGSNAATSPSYANGVGAYATDQYLVTPQLTLNGTLIFYAASTYYDEFEVLLSTTTNDMSAFTTTLRPMTAVSTNSGWDKVTIDLSDYAGQQGYIAIHHVFADGYFLIIDDFGLYEIAGDDDWITVSTDAQFVDIEDLDPETEYEWQVRGENRGCTNGEEEGYTPWSTVSTFTTPGLCDPFAGIYIDELTATSITLSWMGYQQSYNVRYRTPGSADEIFYDDFTEYDDIDGDGYITIADIDWTGSNLNEDETQPSTIYTLNFTDGSSMTVFGFAGNNTDQYLISPELEGVVEGSALEFMYYAYEGSTQTFQVGFSSTDNALTSFTWVDAYTTDEEDYYDYYEVEVPAGTKYFAIKSSGASNILLLGDFYVYANYVPAGEWITYEGVTSPYTINGLTPETEYQVQIQGICGEEETTDWYGGYFITPDAQIIALVEGTNWFSTNREITLEELQNALVAALPETAITIKSKTESTKYIVRTHRWNGTLSWDIRNMYMIEVTADCEITLEGTLLDPAEHPITIAPNTANWIGYMLTETMGLDAALVNFPAVNSDGIKSKTGTARFTRGNWRPNGLEQLVPGQGYILTPASTVTEDRTFTYPAGASKSVQSSTSTSLMSNHRLPANHTMKVVANITK